MIVLFNSRLSETLNCDLSPLCHQRCSLVGHFQQVGGVEVGLQGGAVHYRALYMRLSCDCHVTTYLDLFKDLLLWV